MRVIFDFYLIHPSFITNCNQVELIKFIENVLIVNTDSTIIFEDISDFLNINPLVKNYTEFITNMIIYSEHYKSRIFVLAGESMYSYARRIIKKNKSVCFVNFPYPELRSLYTYILECNKNGIKYASLDFNQKRKTAGINLIKTDVKMVVDVKKISINYNPIDALDTLTCRKKYYQIEPYSDASTPSSFIYTFMSGKNKMILKSSKYITPDYLMKMEDLIELRDYFKSQQIVEALPQNIVYDNNVARGIVFNYIEGPSFEKMYHDVYYTQFMEKNKYEPNIVNRIYLLLKLFAAVSVYHSLGIFFSDIKGDNFIVTEDCDVIPIDTDGFCYYQYYSSCPRPEMMFNPDKDHKRAFLQNAEIERYAIMVMTYCFLMDGNYPTSKKNKFTLKNINDSPNSIEDTEKGKILLKKWKQYPVYVREILYSGIVENKVLSINEMLKVFLRYYAELTCTSENNISAWINRKPLVQELDKSWNSSSTVLFEYVNPQRKQEKGNSDSKVGSIFDSILGEENKSNIDENQKNSHETKNTQAASLGNQTGVTNGGSTSSTSNNTSSTSSIPTKKNHKKIWLTIVAVLLVLGGIVFGLYLADKYGFIDFSSGVLIEETERDDSNDLPIITSNYNDDLSHISKDVKVVANTDNISIDKSSSGSFMITAKGSLPDTFNYSVSFPNGLETSWGEWEDDYVSCSLTIKGVQSGRYTIRVYLNVEESIIIAYKELTVNVF